MKVTYIVKSKLNFYPPCVTQIRLLRQFGVDIDVLYGSCTDNVLRIFDNEGIPYNKLCDLRDVYKGKLDKANNWLTFRKALAKELKKRDTSNTLLWFGNAETLLAMKGALSKYKYAVTFLELLDDKCFRMFLLKDMARKAKFIVSCEETRSYIMKAWWRLDKLPYTIPNKPFDDPSRLSTLTDEKAKAVLEKIGNRKFIIYQGIIKEPVILAQFANAINRLADDIVLLIMGPDPENIIPEISRISQKIIYSPYIAAPNHFQVTSRARIGIVYYNGDSSLNRAFCAPNKIYEYSAFGMPMIANNIPGLKNTVGVYGAACCINLIEEEIIKAINSIDNHYEEMSSRAKMFFESTDIRMIMREIVKENICNNESKN